MEKNYKVLIVDDIFNNRFLIKQIVKKVNAKCFEAENGKQAIEILERNDIDIILMDIEMPVMNGIEATKHIRQKFTNQKKSIPIVALTAHNPLTFFNDYRDVGFNQLLTKPYSVNKVLSVIQEFGKL
ncbi:MAG: response regulator [Bacteroidales bacterium]|nr:response regulator [Bacteroidales bacterium]MDD4672329.1 response regulator [Bacteroidales bacterium]MDY0349180.1 response regulator [Tenuifilaceae bacterium]